MKNKLKSTWEWLKKRPLAIANLSGMLIIVIGGASAFLYFVTVEIDVLDNWKVQTTTQGEDGKLPVYSPGGTLEFISTSTKVRSATGDISRIFDCDPTDTMQAREISLPPVMANRAPGYNPPKENVIIVPAVNEFDGLPRTCRIIFNICYEDVILWRDHCETARTNDFLVQEKTLNAEDVRVQIDELENRIHELEEQLLTFEESESGRLLSVIKL